MKITMLERLMRKVEMVTESGCWIWMASINAWGYGCFAIRGKGKTRSKLAHRIAYTLFKGPISKDKEIDHLCRVRCCVNPDHLEAVTRRVNVHRGISPPALNKKKLVCSRGHLLSGSNCYFYDGGRHCKECYNICKRKRRLQLKMARVDKLKAVPSSSPQ